MGGVKGVKELTQRIRKLAKAGRKIGNALVRGAMGELKTAAVQASPGTIKDEVAERLDKGDATTVRGKVGLEVGGMTSKNPHGRFVTLGTRFIAARRFIGNAMRDAMPRAIRAGVASGKRALAKFTRKGGA